MHFGTFVAREPIGGQGVICAVSLWRYPQPLTLKPVDEISGGLFLWHSHSPARQEL